MIPFMIALRRMKYLAMNFDKEVKNFYAKNYKVLLKKLLSM